MVTNEIAEYYDVTTDREVRADLRFAADLVTQEKIAIDCGCGAGRDIAFLRDKGFIVHGFDLEAESIRRCRERFGEDPGVFLSQASFNSFIYPSAALIVADASLFFCPEGDFEDVWCKITESLVPGGIFAGSFLGPEDTMAGPEYNREAFWPDVLTFTEDSLRPRFYGFEILRWTEHNFLGETAQGAPHHWHIYSVVAKKR